MTPSSLRSEKKSLRRKIHSRLDSLNPKIITSASKSISATVVNLPVWKSSSVVLVFLSMDNEVDTSMILRTAFEQDKTVALPRMHDDRILFHHIDSPDGPFDKHPYGIEEPKADRPVIYPPSTGSSDQTPGGAGKRAQKIDRVSSDHPVLIITPGCAFDRLGHRLGHGMGYYDNFFASMSRAEKVPYRSVAVCFDIQLVDRVPVGDYDVKVDMIITESGIVYRR